MLTLSLTLYRIHPNSLLAKAELIYIISDHHCTMRSTVLITFFVAQEVVRGSTKSFSQFCEQLLHSQFFTSAKFRKWLF